MDDVLTRFLSFLDGAPTPLHAVASAVARLEAAGFSAVSAADPPPRLAPGATGYVRQDGSLFAFRVGTKPPVEAGFRVIAAHTDSPNLRIKPQPLLKGQGYLRVGVDVYGGAQIATWVDRDLGIAGAVHVRSGGGIDTRLIDIRRPVARVPTLAIHLNRTVNDDGLKLNPQTQLPAVLALEVDGGADPLRALLADAAGCVPADLVTWDLSLFDLTPAVRGGAGGEFVFSGRLDNLASCHAALEAMLSDGSAPDATTVVALFDHEEIGSRTNRGADGRAIEVVLGWLCGDGSALDRALARSWLVSADMAHAIHPAFADKAEPEHAPRMNGGPAIKLNVNQRYTTEGATAAMFVLLCERAEVPHQWYVHRSDLACGSTVGPMLASRLGVRSVDVGNPMLSMHSAREQCGAVDHGSMIRVMARFLRDDLG
ncbi:MAG: M18 family aminopeptidase [Myxococcota bacterium]